MVARNVPMYQAKIPIRGGGGIGHIDLREREGTNPIVAALQQMMERKRQQEQDELDRRIAESQIGLRGAQTEALGREKQPTMKIQIGADGNTYTINPVTREAKPVLTSDGKPLKASPKVAELLKLIEMARQYEEPSETEKAISGSAEEELLGLRGLEEVEVPGEKRKRWGLDILAKDIPPRKEIRKKTPITEALEEPRKRKRVESKEKVKMKAPDGKTYEVDRSEVKEAKKRGWVVL